MAVLNAFKDHLNLPVLGGSPLLSGAVLLLLFCTAYLFVSSANAWRRLRHFPGAFFARISYLPLLRQTWNANLLATLDELEQKYGKLVCIGPNDLLCADADEIARISGVRSAWGRGGWYRIISFDPDNDSMVTAMDPPSHDKRKAMVMRGYEGRGLVKWEEVVDSQLDIMLCLLREKYASPGSTAVVDWAAMARYFSLDVAVTAVTGKSWGTLPSEKDVHGFFSVGEALIPFMHCLAVWKGVRSIIASPRIMRMIGPGLGDKSGLGHFMGQVHAETAKRVADPHAKGNDLISDFLNNGLAPRDCETEAVLAAIAGSDTAASPIRHIMMFLVSTPYVYNKLKAEISEGIKNGKISNPVRHAEAQQLPYLQAVLHEGFRIMPTTLTGFPKRVPPEGDTVCGMQVPPGTDIYPNNRAILLDKSVYGEDAHVFRPERWIECTPEVRTVMGRNLDIIFSKGRWQCPGKNLAWMELHKVYVELLRNFDIQIVNPGTQPWKIRSYTTIVIEDFYLRFTEAKLV